MSTESNFSYTTKINNDLFTVRGDTFDDFFKHLVAAATVPAINALVSVLDGKAPAPSNEAAVATVAASLGGSVVDDPFGGTFAPVTPPAGASAGDRSCKHGVMNKRIGNSAKGEWRAWMCPHPTKGEQCPPIWANKKNPAEWNVF